MAQPQSALRAIDQSYLMGIGQGPAPARVPRTRGQTTADMLGAAAIGTTPIPIVGDIVGAAADVAMFASDPTTRTLPNYAMSALGMLPLVPGVSALRALKDAPDAADSGLVTRQLGGTKVEIRDPANPGLRLTLASDPEEGPFMSPYLEILGDEEQIGGRGTATKLYLEGLSRAKAGGLGWQSDSILSDASYKMYERLKNLGVPFSEATTGSKYSISAADLANVDIGRMQSDFLGRQSPSPLEGTLDMSQAARMQRAADFGGERDWYRGSVVDEGDELQKELLGINTGSPSAYKGFFFASSPETASSPIYTTATDDQIMSFVDSKYGSLENMLGQSNINIDAKARKEFDIFDSQDYDLKDEHELHFYNSLKQLINNSPSKNVSGGTPDDFGYSDQNQRLMETVYEFMRRPADNSVPSISSDLKAIVNNTMPELSKSLEVKKDIDLVRQHMNLSAKYDPEYMRGGEDALPALSFREKEIAPNVGQYKLNMQNPYIKDMKGAAYRNESYNQIIKDALSGGHDSVIIKNTYDGGNEITDVGIVFEPNQARSTSAAFDPAKRSSANLMAGAAGATIGLSALRNIQRDEQPQPD